MYRRIIYLMIPVLLFITSCSDDENSDVTEEEVQVELEDEVELENEEESEEETNENSFSVTEEILELVNDHRNSIGLSSLERNTTADNLVIDHTNYMISEESIGHDNFSERAEQLQLEENAVSVAENVASGFPTAQAVVAGWLNSASHRGNIEGNYSYTGIAAIQNAQGTYYYTQLFYR